MTRYEFTLKGISPLLIHADDVEQADRLEEWRKNPKNKSKSKAGDDRSPPWTWTTYLYTDDKHLVLPAECIMTTLRNAGASLKMQRTTSYKKAVVSSLQIDEPKLALYADGKLLMAEQFDTISKMEEFREQADAVREIPGCRLLLKRAKLGKAKHVRVRLHVENWSLSGHIVMVDQTISDDILRQVFSLAGRFSGLGDWRPSSPMAPGRYGMFTADLKKLKD